MRIIENIKQTNSNIQNIDLLKFILSMIVYINYHSICGYGLFLHNMLIAQLTYN